MHAIKCIRPLRWCILHQEPIHTGIISINICIGYVFTQVRKSYIFHATWNVCRCEIGAVADHSLVLLVKNPLHMHSITYFDIIQWMNEQWTRSLDTGGCAIGIWWIVQMHWRMKCQQNFMNISTIPLVKWFASKNLILIAR